MRKTLNIPYGFIKHMHADENYCYDNFKLTMSDKNIFALYADEDGGKNNATLIRYNCESKWIYSLKTVMLKETLDLFVELCNRYYELGDMIIKMTEYGIMGE